MTLMKRKRPNNNWTKTSGKLPGFSTGKYLQDFQTRIPVPKNKLKKFAEINSFSNVIQPQNFHGGIEPFPYKGSWNKFFFGNTNPVVLEIGCGKGEYTVGLGSAYPDVNFIGIDIKGDRIWKGAREALENGLHNTAFLRIQAEWITHFFGEKEISGIWLTFPDPQEKKIRAKKRFTATPFLERYKKIVVPGSPIILKTDNASLYQYTLSVIRDGKHILLESSDNLYADEDIRQPLLKEIQTYYEKSFLAAGKPIHYIKFSLNEGTT